jgi:hypothetical protein
MTGVRENFFGMIVLSDQPEMGYESNFQFARENPREMNGLRPEEEWIANGCRSMR